MHGVLMAVHWCMSQGNLGLISLPTLHTQQKVAAVPVVVSGGPQRKTSTNLPPLGLASVGRQRKISRSPFPPTLEGNSQIGVAPSGTAFPSALWMDRADKVRALKWRTQPLSGGGRVYVCLFPGAVRVRVRVQVL